MIKLSKSTNTPATLSSNEVTVQKNILNQMVASNQNPKQDDFDSSLYGADDVRAQLMADQHGKCLFCECTLLDKGGGEVEHYRPKTAVRQDRTPGNTRRPAYYFLAYEWDNLSLCCHECNRRKSTYFPLANDAVRFNLAAEEPYIINPYLEDPSNHIEFRQYIVHALCNEDGTVDALGDRTKDYIELNRPDLKELRRRRLFDFNKIRERQNLTFDQMIAQMQSDAVDDGRTPESIEFLGMYQNQKYKF